MKVITEERLREIFDAEVDNGICSVKDLINNELQEIDTLTVSKLRPMCDAPKGREPILVFYSGHFDTVFWSDQYGKWQYDENSFYRDEMLQGWIPMPTYRRELTGGGE